MDSGLVHHVHSQIYINVSEKLAAGICWVEELRPVRFAEYGNKIV
jgi:hypothetical protein